MSAASAIKLPSSSTTVRDYRNLNTADEGRVVAELRSGLPTYSLEDYYAGTIASDDNKGKSIYNPTPGG